MREWLMNFLSGPQHARPDSRSLEAWIQDKTVTIGRETYGEPRIVAYNYDSGKVSIGAFCSIAEDVEIFLGGNHRFDWVSTFPFRIKFGIGDPNDGMVWSKGDVRIGSDVWIGRGAKILSGVEIGSGAVIGAHSVVAKNVGAYEVWVGNPASLRRKRFTEDQIRSLLEIAWWDWPRDAIESNIDYLNGDSIEEFIARFSR